MSSAWTVDIRETVAQPRAEAVPLSHLSIELGHLYFEEFAAGPEALEDYFRRIAPWVEAATRILTDRVPSRKPRVSTCFLIDDYFTRFSSPAEVLPQVIKAAESQNLTIDYLARESGCVSADGIPLADLMLGRIVSDPEPGSTGVRPPATVSGWLCNGQRTPQAVNGQAMSANRAWQPPTENGALNHSIFVDVELWDEVDGRRRWSCPYLAAVWQLMRLGLLRYDGAAVVRPAKVDQFPDEWERLPAVVRVNPKAQAFSAYSTFSVLGSRFLSIEHAVRTILQQVNVERVIADQIRDRSAAEGMPVPAEVWKRIEYLIVADHD